MTLRRRLSRTRETISGFSITAKVTAGLPDDWSTCSTRLMPLATCATSIRPRIKRNTLPVRAFIVATVDVAIDDVDDDLSCCFIVFALLNVCVCVTMMTNDFVAFLKGNGKD